MKGGKMDYDDLFLFIGGEWISAADRETMPVINPASGLRIGDLPVATTDDLDAAAQAAAHAFQTWQHVPAYDRAAILHRAADLIRARAPEIGRITTIEQGKPLAESTAETFGAADVIDWFAEEGRRNYGRIVPSRSTTVRNLVLRQPVGPVAAFTPWNFPITIPARKIGGALAAGCTCVIKPAEETPATTLALARAFDDAGLPAGVLSMVFGNPAEVSARLIRSPHIRKVSFTGSTAVGRQIAALAAEGVKRVTLELGGHAPVLVFDDADISQAVRLSVATKFRNAGQVCISPTRFYVQGGVYPRFLEEFSAAAQALRVGDGLDPSTNMGPLAHDRRPRAVEALVQDAVDNGAKVLTGGRGAGSSGYFWEPTVLANVSDSSRAMNEEPFGPMALVAPFGSFDEAMTLANRLPYGLASYAFTGSLQTAHALSESIESGMVGINHFFIQGPETPFGGVKESGYGSEGGSEGLDDYLFSKLVSQA
jgi:succinate-semialdehyde dehydrogenase/glutarate-semialdehyde dehydrogenase